MRGWMALMMLSLSPLALAQDIESSVKSPFSAFSLGAGYYNLSGSGSLAGVFSANADYRQLFGDHDYGFSGLAAPLFQTNGSLLGVLASAGFTAKIFGQTRIQKTVLEGNYPVLSYERSNSKWVGFIDLGLTFLPIFGSNNTATYTGFGGGLSLYYFSRINLEGSLKFYRTSLSDRSLSALGMSLGLVFGI